MKLADIEAVTRLESESLLKFTSQEADPNGVSAPIGLDFQTRVHHWLAYLSGASSPKDARRERMMLKACLDTKMIGFIAGHLTTRFGKDAEIEAFCTLDCDQQNHAWVQLLLRFIAWAEQHEAKSLCVGIGPEHSEYKDFFLQYGATFLNPYWIYWDNMSALAELIRNPDRLRLT